MKPDGACSRADLARALARGDQVLADTLAGLLGFEVIEKPKQAIVDTTTVAYTIRILLANPN